MPNEIVVNSISLGTTQNAGRSEFFAEYAPSAVPPLNSLCALPPGLDLNISTTQLTPLVPSCAVEFPDTIPLPPVFNPASIKFPACEQLSASADITYCGFTAESGLHLIADGPASAADGAPAECSLSLKGTLCITACDEISITENINLTGFVAGSSLGLVHPADDPNCGLVLNANLEVDACSSVTVENNIRMGGVFERTGATLELLPSEGTDGCGINLSGVFDFDACQSVVITNPTDKPIISGDGVTGTLTFDVDVDNPCQINIGGGIEIKACTQLEQLGSFKLKGNAFKPKDDTEQFDPNKVYQELTITHAKTPNGEEELCSMSLNGEIYLDACTSFSVDSSNFKVSGNAVKVVDSKGETLNQIKFSPTSSPDCGIQVEGELKINACTSIEVKGADDTNDKLALVGFKDGSSLGLSLIESTDESSKGCGVQLAGKLEVSPPCSTVTLTSKQVPGTLGHVVFKDQDGKALTSPETIELAPNFATEVSEDGCSFSFTPDLGKYEFTLSLPKVQASTDPLVAEECCNYDSDNLTKLSLTQKTGEDNKWELKVDGKLPLPCYRCDSDPENPYVRTEMELSKLAVDTIVQTTCSGGSNVLRLVPLDNDPPQLYLANSPENYVNLEPPPSGIATWKQIELCENGVVKQFYVLMTEAIN